MPVAAAVVLGKSQGRAGGNEGKECLHGDRAGCRGCEEYEVGRGLQDLRRDRGTTRTAAFVSEEDLLARVMASILWASCAVLFSPQQSIGKAE